MLYLSLVLYHVGVSEGGNVVRALYLGFCATTLLLAFFGKTTPITSLFTTTSSAFVAPYLAQPSGYIRPHIAKIVEQKQLYLLTLAQRHNHAQSTHISDHEFAAIMVTILYTEHLGWLEDVMPSIRPVTPVYQEAQAVSNEYLGTNFSVWPANLRPSVVDEILSDEIPQVGRANLALLIPHSLQRPEHANQLARTTDTALALLAANLERGIIRAQHEHVPITWKTLLAWHNAGIVDPIQMAQNRSLQHYLQRAIVYHEPALALYRTDILCINPLYAHNAPTVPDTH